MKYKIIKSYQGKRSWKGGIIKDGLIELTEPCLQ